MVDQIEAETAAIGDNGGQGRLPSHFATFTCAVYKWAQLHDMLEKLLPHEVVAARKPFDQLSEAEKRDRFYKDSLENPGFVSWYCAVKLEQMVYLAVATIARQLQGYQFDPAEWRPTQLDESCDSVKQLAPRMDDDNCRVDDWYASFEWGAGGIVHVHCVFWVKGAPRVDCVIRPDEDGNLPNDLSEAHAAHAPVLEEDVAGIFASFHDRVYTEWNAKKPADGSEAERLGERERRRRDGTERATRDPCSTSWSDLREIIGAGAGDADQAKARLHFCATLAEWSNMHDWHAPHPGGPPQQKQSCSRVVKGTEDTGQEVCYCSKLFPRPVRMPGNEALAEDPHRRDLHRIWLARNCHYLNNFHPFLLLALLANMDIQAVTSRYAVIEYITKYMTKTGKGTLFSQAEEDFDEALQAASEQGKGVMAAVAKFFNKQVAPRAISQLEVHHILWRFPPFISSRGFTRLSLNVELKKCVPEARLRAT